MGRKTFAWVAVGLAFGVATAAVAEEKAMTIGEMEYRNSCVQCHGLGGKGDGPMAIVLKSGAPDLTGLQKANGGVFPVSHVYNMIKGDGLSGAHGTSEMPAWGLRYRIAAPDMVGPYGTREDEDAFVQARILGLIEYISSLQEK
ncbi:c-type cytochrome [Acidimangrovimonas sediminis]|uniref:c-type cytochrome n=1 Tax=Acidimangrovimonas sediminis TaxID=2056283 RepID=UPI000C80D3C2|nr:cytochrome c [Acidimangrovimonas sediminis]